MTHRFNSTTKDVAKKSFTQLTFSLLLILLLGSFALAGLALSTGFTSSQAGITGRAPSGITSLIREEPAPAPERLFRFDFPEFLVGTAEYAAGPTGCTVFHFPKGATGAVDIRGGAAAVRESSSLDPLNAWGWVDAIVLAGGSTYGLDAASGVMHRILELRGRSTHFDSIPAVPAAVVYDFSGRENALFPDHQLGALAFDNARTNQVRVGPAGAGANVSVGKYFGRETAERSGQGAAVIQAGEVKIFGLTVVNALGNVLDRNGRILAGSLDPKTGSRFSIQDRLADIAESFTAGEGAAPHKQVKGNTTISIIITNAEITRTDLSRLAATAHTAMGRVIEPFQTPSDGDTLFAVTTGTVKLPEGWGVADLGVLAGKVMQDAVIDAVKRDSEQVEMELSEAE